jgi:hypothetical protein
MAPMSAARTIGGVAPAGLVPFPRRRGSGDREGEGAGRRAQCRGGGRRRRWAGLEREERACIGIGTNLPFSEWGSVIPDPRLVAAIVDRVTFNAHILETGTESYRLRTSKNSSRRKRAS